jgi:hypothetical protein
MQRVVNKIKEQDKYDWAYYGLSLATLFGLWYVLAFHSL